jgi:hypothetical protein
MKFNKDIHNFQSNVFTIVIYVTWTLYILIALGLTAEFPQYLATLQSLVKIYISLFLMLRFNPFRQVKFTPLDARIAFSAGLFLFATTAIDKLLLTTFEKVVPNISN